MFTLERPYHVYRQRRGHGRPKIHHLPDTRAALAIKGHDDLRLKGCGVERLPLVSKIAAGLVGVPVLRWLPRIALTAPDGQHCQCCMNVYPNCHHDLALQELKTVVLMTCAEPYSFGTGRSNSTYSGLALSSATSFCSSATSRSSSATSSALSAARSASSASVAC